MKFTFFEVLMSYLKVSLRAYDMTKNEVSIVKIPRMVVNDPNERVATSSTFWPSTPMKIALKRMYNIMGIKVPIMIAFLNSFS